MSVKSAGLITQFGYNHSCVWAGKVVCVWLSGEMKSKKEVF